MSRLLLPATVILALALAASCGAEVRESGGGKEGGEGEDASVRLAVVPKAIGLRLLGAGPQPAPSARRDVRGGGSDSGDGVTAETDVTGQQTLLQNFITQGVEGLVYAAPPTPGCSPDVSQTGHRPGPDVVNIGLRHRTSAQ
jgi:ribose transport system substrate-binding protein